MVDIISFSGGRDSTAMVLKMHEMNQLADKIILHVTMEEWEHPQMLVHIKKVEEYINHKIVVITAFKNATLTEKMLNHVVHKRDGTIQKGYWWCGKARWGTTYKVLAIKRYYKQFKKEGVREFIGYALDEKHPARQIKIKNYIENKIDKLVYPLIDWGMTEQAALDYCYDRGFDWGGLYELYDRVSCWCCQNSNMKELQAMYDNEPEKWEQLKQMDSKIEKRVIEKYGEYSSKHRFKVKYSFSELEEKLKNKKE